MAAGDPDPVDSRVLMDRSLTLVGGDLWNVLTGAQARQQNAGRLFATAQRLALRDGAKAHAMLEALGNVGKVLLIP